MTLRFLASFATASSFMLAAAACAPAAPASSPPSAPAQAAVAPANSADNAAAITTTVAAPIAQPLPQGAVWVDAAQKRAEGVTQLLARGSAKPADVMMSWHEWFRAVRETGVQGADLVAAADKYQQQATQARDIVNLQYQKGAASKDDLLVANAEVAEAAYWSAWAHNRP